MTTNPADMSLDDIRRAADEAQPYVDQIRAARADQPERLAKAREDADEARGWSLLEEPWNTLISTIPANNSEGQRTGEAPALPNITDGYDIGANALDAEGPQ
jgi:hypothetical protein